MLLPVQALAVGVADRLFGTNGTVTVDVGNNATAQNVVLQPDGKIIIAGYYTSDANGVDGVLARLNKDGGLDTSFGRNGIVRSSLSARDDGRYFGNYDSKGSFNCNRLCNYSGSSFVSFPNGNTAYSYAQYDLYGDGGILVVNKQGKRVGYYTRGVLGFKNIAQADNKIVSLDDDGFKISRFSITSQGTRLAARGCDNKTSIAVYRPADRVLYRLKSAAADNYAARLPTVATKSRHDGGKARRNLPVAVCGSDK